MFFPPEMMSSINAGASTRISTVKSLLQTTYFQMYKKTPGRILKTLHNDIKPCLSISGKLNIPNEDFDEESKLEILFRIEGILNYAILRAFGDNCLKEVSLEEVRECRVFAADLMSFLKDRPGIAKAVTKTVTDNWFGAFEEDKKLKESVSLT